jgi:hypothetical protein
MPLKGAKYSEYGWPHISAQAVLESSSTSYWLSRRVKFDLRPVHVGCRGYFAPPLPYHSTYSHSSILNAI